MGKKKKGTYSSFAERNSEKTAEKEISRKVIILDQDLEKDMIDIIGLASVERWEENQSLHKGKQRNKGKEARKRSKGKADDRRMEERAVAIYRCINF